MEYLGAEANFWIEKKKRKPRIESDSTEFTMYKAKKHGQNQSLNLESLHLLSDLQSQSLIWKIFQWICQGCSSTGNNSLIWLHGFPKWAAGPLFFRVDKLHDIKSVSPVSYQMCVHMFLGWFLEHWALLSLISTKESENLSQLLANLLYFSTLSTRFCVLIDHTSVQGL